MRSFQLLRRHMIFRSGGSLRVHQTTSSQWGVLVFIEQQGSSTVKEIAKELGITSSATTQLVDGLVSAGYVSRETHTVDRRSVLLTLSPTIKTKIDKMKKQVLKKFLTFFDALNDTELNHYSLLTSKIVEKLLKNKDI